MSRWAPPPGKGELPALLAVRLRQWLTAFQATLCSCTPLYALHLTPHHAAVLPELAADIHHRPARDQEVDDTCLLVR